MTPVDLEIEGMTCASCAGRIERRLRKLPGVEASVQYATESARITLPEGVTVADAIAAVEASGYRASLPREHERRTTLPLILRLVVSATLAVPVVALSMMPALQMPGWQWTALALTLPIALWGAWPFHRAAAANLAHRAATMDTLVSIGILASLGWSIWALVWGDAAAGGMEMGGAEGDALYLEVAAAVTVFLLAGRLIEATARRANADALHAVARLGAREATRIVDGAEERIPVAALRVGDVIRVLPGEKIATDGIVTEGASSVDASLVTGESVPVEAAAGTAVVGATINGHGVLHIRATAVGADTELARMAALLEGAQQGRTAVGRLADRISQVFVPTVLVLAVLTLAGWWLATSDLRAAFTAAVATLIIACPCALGLATPMALLVGTTRGAKHGILIRDARVLESARGIRVLLADKTGTITHGGMRVEHVEHSGAERDDVLRMAAAVERGSEHPIARAIVAAAPDAPIAHDVQAIPGEGVTGMVDGERVHVGKPSWMRESGTELCPALARAAGAAAETGATVVAVAWGGMVRGIVTVRDTVRPTSRATIARLARLGITTTMVTGDNERAARAIAAEVGIHDVIANATPADKLAAVDTARSAGAVAMVGDGVNDAAAIAAADLGIAMGTGTDAARHAADMALVNGDLASAADAIVLARRTLTTIKANLFWAFAYNTVAIPLAMAGLLSPLIAGLAMVCSSAFVVLGSLTLHVGAPWPRRASHP